MLRGIICVTLAVTFICLCDAHAARTTRDLVFEDEPTKQVTPANTEVTGGTQSIGIKTTVILERDGQMSTVLPSHEFQSGDKVKIVFTPSEDGYVYWMAKGSSGQYQMLFPSPKAGSDNIVKRNQEYTVPVSGNFRFDNTPGSEELLCILSTERLADLDAAAAEEFKNAAKQIVALEENHAAKRSTRDLVFEEDETDNVSTKKQMAAKGEPFVTSYILKHN